MTRPRRARHIVIAAVLTLLPLVPAWALLSGISSLDRLVASSAVIVKARITHAENLTESVAFSATVLAIVKTDGQVVPQELQAVVPAQVWPSQMGWPLREQRTVLVMLERESRRSGLRPLETSGAVATAKADLRISNCVNAIIPAPIQLLEYPARSSPAQRVFLEFKTAIESIPDGLPKARALATLSSVASVADSQTFHRYAGSQNEWMRSAALAGIARIDPRPGNIATMLEDLGRRGALGDASNTDPEIEFRTVWFDLADVARCGAWGRDQAMCARARAYLPVYRAFADTAGATWRARLAIEALKDVGTNEDLLRLYRHHEDREDFVRHEVLEGLSRILGLDVKRPEVLAYGMPLAPDVIRWERSAQATIEAALKARGVI